MKSYVFKITALIWAVNFILLSHFSKYDATNVHSLNWDIVVMLTPLGLLNNFIIHPESYLRPYYQNHASPQEPMVLAFLLVHLALTVFLLSRIRRGGRS